MLQGSPPRMLALLAAAALLMSMSACSVAPKDSTAESQLHDDVQFTLRTFMRHDPSLTNELEDSYGYAVFPAIGQFGLLTAMSVIYAYLASLLVLPSVLAIWAQLISTPGLTSSPP